MDCQLFYMPVNCSLVCLYFLLHFHIVFSEFSKFLSQLFICGFSNVIEFLLQFVLLLLPNTLLLLELSFVELSLFIMTAIEFCIVFLEVVDFILFSLDLLSRLFTESLYLLIQLLNLDVLCLDKLVQLFLLILHNHTYLLFLVDLTE